MQSVYLRFYVTEKQRHDGALLYEWLLGEAKKLGELPVQVEFVLDTVLADKLLGALRAHKLNLFYVRYAVESGVL